MGLPAAQQWKEFQSGIGTAEQEVRHRAQWAHTPGSREGMVVGKQFRTAGAGWRLKGCNKILSPHIPYWQSERSNSSRKQPKSKRADSREKQHPQSHRTKNDCGFFSFGHDKNYDKTANMSKQIYRGKKCQTSKSHNLEEITAYYSLLEGSSAVVTTSHHEVTMSPTKGRTCSCVNASAASRHWGIPQVSLLSRPPNGATHNSLQQREFILAATRRFRHLPGNSTQIFTLHAKCPCSS